MTIRRFELSKRIIEQPDPVIDVHVSGVADPEDVMADVRQYGGDSLPPVVRECAAEMSCKEKVENPK